MGFEGVEYESICFSDIVGVDVFFLQESLYLLPLVPCLFPKFLIILPLFCALITLGILFEHVSIYASDVVPVEVTTGGFLYLPP